MNWNHSGEPYPATYERPPTTQEDPHHPWATPGSFGSAPTVADLDMEDEHMRWWRPSDVSAEGLTIRPMENSSLLQATEMAADNLILGPIAEESRFTGAGVWLFIKRALGPGSTIQKRPHSTRTSPDFRRTIS